MNVNGEILVGGDIIDLYSSLFALYKGYGLASAHLCDNASI